jgi:hypothetical protein
MFECNGDRKKVLSVLWIFLTVNYIYCDIFSLHHAETLQAFLSGQMGGMRLTEEFLLSFAFIMQIPMIMIVLSRFLVFKFNKCLNIIAALISGSIQSYTLYVIHGWNPALCIFQRRRNKYGYTHNLFCNYVEKN